jgi:hypothetical protein
MDDILSGNPRTLMDHKEMAARATQKQSAEDTSIVAVQGGLHIATVIKVDPAEGAVLLDTFSDGTAEGSWLRVLNFTQPVPGESVIWAYVDGSPCVLGTLPDNMRPWRVPATGMPDTFFFEDFERGFGDFITQLGTGANSDAFGGVENHPGVAELGSGTTSGSEARLRLEETNMNLSNVGEAEFMVQGTGTGNHRYIVGVCNSIETREEGVFVGFDSDSILSATNWRAWGSIGGGTVSEQVFDPIVPYVQNNWYKIGFKQLEPGSWVVTIEDVTAGTVEFPVQGSALIKGANASLTQNGIVGAEIRTHSTTAKFMHIDYIWYTMRQVARR